MIGKNRYGEAVAVSIMDLIVPKSARQREADFRKYERWAFPYGADQRKIGEQRLRELLPEDDAVTAMAVYLLGREGYRGHYKEDPEDLLERTEEEKLLGGWQMLKNQLPGSRRKRIPRYLALIIADAQVDESLCYPSAEALAQSAQQLEVQLKKR